MRNKNSAFEADSAPGGLGLGEGYGGGATWVGAVCRSRVRGREGYPSAPWGASVNALRDIGQRLEGYQSGGWRIGLRRSGRGGRAVLRTRWEAPCWGTVLQRVGRWMRPAGYLRVHRGRQPSPLPKLLYLCF